MPIKFNVTSGIEKIGQVHFRHEALMLVELSNGAQLGWSTLPGLTALLGEGVSNLHHGNVDIKKDDAKKHSVIFSNFKVRVPVIRSREEDENRDGLADSLTISLNLPLRFKKSYSTS